MHANQSCSCLAQYKLSARIFGKKYMSIYVSEHVLKVILLARALVKYILVSSRKVYIQARGMHNGWPLFSSVICLRSVNHYQILSLFSCHVPIPLIFLNHYLNQHLQATCLSHSHIIELSGHTMFTSWAMSFLCFYFLLSFFWVQPVAVWRPLYSEVCWHHMPVSMMLQVAHLIQHLKG